MKTLQRRQLDRCEKPELAEIIERNIRLIDEHPREGARLMNILLYIRAAILASIAWAALFADASFTSAETIHFLVAERPEDAVHGDSYVLPLSDAAAIAHARALIDAEPGTLPSIVVAHIAAGADGANRDHLAPGAPAWSWHVTEFEGFSDFAIEILDGWPSFVEQDVDGWIANTGGTIGFWSYTVVAELPAVPEPKTAVLLVAGLVLARAAFTTYTPQRVRRDQ
jgi:hypothetical protein